MNKKEIAMRILELREKNHLTQQEVADVLGIKQPAYSELESGATALKAADLDKLATFYEMSLDEFLRADQPVLNMYENKVAHGYNVIHTQTQNGITEDLFSRLCDILEGNTTVLRDIADQQAKMIELLSKSAK